MVGTCKNRVISYQEVGLQSFCDYYNCYPLFLKFILTMEDVTWFSVLNVPSLKSKD